MDDHVWVSGLLIPASLSTALTITEGGYINVRNNVIDLDWVQLLLSPFAWSVVFWQLFQFYIFHQDF